MNITSILQNLNTFTNSQWCVFKYDPISSFLHEGLSCMRSRADQKLIQEDPHIVLRERVIMSATGMIGGFAAYKLAMFCFAMKQVNPSIHSVLCSGLCVILGYAITAIIAYLLQQIPCKKDIESAGHQA